MARTRSVLIDNTLGRIFRNVTSVGSANAANLIAGLKLESAAIAAAKRTVARPTLNLGNNGIFFVGGALINLVSVSAATAPAGQPIIVRLRVGEDYASSTEHSQYQLSGRSENFPVTITVPQGHSVFFDIVQAGSVRTGAGVGVRLSFYRG